MPRQLFKRLLPHPDHVRNHRHLRHFGTLLHDPNLWHLNRRSLCGAVAVGVFWAMIPLPLQMVAAGFFAIWLRVNLPLSVALVWLTNPLTIPPVFYFNYRIGAWLLGETHASTFEWSPAGMVHELAEIGAPLYLGSLVVAIFSSALGYLAVAGFWRWYIWRHLQKRARRQRPPTDASRQGSV